MKPLPQRLLAVCLLPAFLALRASAQTNYPFRNPDLPMEERVNNVLSLMTLEEKVNFLTQRPGVPRLGIPTVGWVEGLHGVAAGRPGNWGRRAPTQTTTFSQSIGLGETWDPEIVRQAGAVQGYETRFLVQRYGRGGLVVRAPNADLGRDPRWGRTEECFGEDPFHVGTMTVAYVKGLQGDHPKYWLSALLLKHFLANSNEEGRTRTSSDFDERLFHEYYAAPFRMGFLEGGAQCFMAAYNAWNKIPCTVHPVMNDVLVKQWGVDGIFSTDAGSLPNLVRQFRYFPDNTTAAAAAVKAGINQFLDNHRAGVNAALATNLLTEADLDRVAKGTLRVFIRLGVLDPTNRVPYARIGAEGEPEPWTTDKHKAIAKLAAQKSIVLLKNANNLLPLDKSKLKAIAVIGPHANAVHFDWYSSEPPYAITPVEGIKAKVGTGVNVQFASGEDVAAAVALAKVSDVAVLCVGNNPNLSNAWQRVTDPGEGREAVDRQIITLDKQEALIKEVLAANSRTVVVLLSSFPYAINWTQEHAPAILHLAHNSQEEGSALADVVFGDYNPAGRLVQTWPKSLDQLPPMMDYNIRNGRTYMYSKHPPLYPFGFGLSYTTFQYARLRTSSSRLAQDGTLTVRVNVKNTGKRAGEEVVQLYVKHLDSKVERPAKELRGFQRVALKPGETRTVELPLPAKSLAYWDESRKAMVVEPDRIEVSVGGSSVDERLTTRVKVQ